MHQYNAVDEDDQDLFSWKKMHLEPTMPIYLKVLIN